MDLGLLGNTACKLKKLVLFLFIKGIGNGKKVVFCLSPTNFASCFP